MDVLHKKIISLIKQAFSPAQSIEIPNRLEPGLVKEMIIAKLSGHQIVSSKRKADACDKKDPTTFYAYLSCLEGGTGQLDRMYKEPPRGRKAA